MVTVFSISMGPKKKAASDSMLLFFCFRLYTELKVFDSHRRTDKEQLSIIIRPLPSLYQAIFDWFHLQ